SARSPLAHSSLSAPHSSQTRSDGFSSTWEGSRIASVSATGHLGVEESSVSKLSLPKLVPYPGLPGKVRPTPLSGTSSDPDRLAPRFGVDRCQGWRLVAQRGPLPR